jgi:hypothetical protein
MHSDVPDQESTTAQSAPQTTSVATAPVAVGSDTDANYDLAALAESGLLVGVANRADVNDFLDGRLTDVEWETLTGALRNHRLIMAQIGAGMIADHREASTVHERRRRPRLVFGRRQAEFVGDSSNGAAAS